MNSNYDFIDVYLFVHKVIESCETYEQTTIAQKLITNYYRQMTKLGIDILTKRNLENKLWYELSEKRLILINNSNK
jgi:hypothetical protein